LYTTYTTLMERLNKLETYEKKEHVQESHFLLARRRTFLRIDLDVVSRNVSILKGLCSQNTG